MSFETTAFLKYAGAVNSNNNKPDSSFISDSKWKMQKLTGGFGWGVTDDVTLRAVWIQTHTQRGSSIYTTPAMFSCLNLLMQIFIIPFLSGYAFLFFDANLKWWCSSCRWLACQKTVVGFGFEAFIVFLPPFSESFQVSTRKFYMSADQMERAGNTGAHMAFILQCFRPWCTQSLLLIHFDQREICATQTWQQNYTAMLIFFYKVQNLSADAQAKKEVLGTPWGKNHKAKKTNLKHFHKVHSTYYTVFINNTFPSLSNIL